MNPERRVIRSNPYYNKKDRGLEKMSDHGWETELELETDFGLLGDGL